MQRMIWWLIVGTKGGLNRALIIRALKERPYNANQLAKLLRLDYKTIRYHLKVLLDNNIITVEGNKYGAVYFPSSNMEKEYEVFEEYLNRMWEKFKDEDDSGEE